MASKVVVGLLNITSTLSSFELTHFISIFTTLNYAMAGSGPPPKPWEQVPASSGSAPFKPPSPGSTSDVVEASGTAKPGEIVTSSQMNPPAASAVLARPVPTRPWEQSYGSGYGGMYQVCTFSSRCFFTLECLLG